MKYKALTSLFLYFLGLTSCLKIIEVDLPELKNKPVVNCLFTNNIPFKVHLSLPKPPTDTAYTNIANAMVQIKDENGKVTQLPYNEDGFYSTTSLLPEPGVLYTISVNIPGYPALIASDSIPKGNPNIDSYFTKSQFGYQEEMEVPYSRCCINFSVTKKNYYLGIDDIYGENTQPLIDLDGSHLWIYGIFSDHPALTTEAPEYYFEDFLMFKNNLYNTQGFQFYFNFYSYPDFFRLFNLSPTCFKYLKTWLIHDYTKEYDFWEVYEPLPMFSNIENGLGIFAGYSFKLYEMYPDTTIFMKND